MHFFTVDVCHLTIRFKGSVCIESDFLNHMGIDPHMAQGHV